MTRLNSGKKVEGLKVDKLYFYEYNILSFKEVKIQREKRRMEGNATRSWSSMLISSFYFYYSSRTFDFILLILYFFFFSIFVSHPTIYHCFMRWSSGPAKYNLLKNNSNLCLNRKKLRSNCEMINYRAGTINQILFP